MKCRWNLIPLEFPKSERLCPTRYLLGIKISLLQTGHPSLDYWCLLMLGKGWWQDTRHSFSWLLQVKMTTCSWQLLLKWGVGTEQVSSNQHLRLCWLSLAQCTSRKADPSRLADTRMYSSLLLIAMGLTSTTEQVWFALKDHQLWGQNLYCDLHHQQIVGESNDPHTLDLMSTMDLQEGG